MPWLIEIRPARRFGASVWLGLALCAVLACGRGETVEPVASGGGSEAVPPAEVAASGPLNEPDPTPRRTRATRRSKAKAPAAGLGDGFLVWESNRSGDWRIWTRTLALSEPRALTPDEPGRQHCCPHVAPGGVWIAYLSVADALAGYARGGSEGELRLIRADGTGGRRLAPSARALWENRAVVWRSDTEMIYIRGDGATVLHDVATDTVEILYADPEARTWLLDATLTHAASGLADFSPYRRAGRSIARRTPFGGCQPYFSRDGRWGFWAAGAGGPVQRVELASGVVSTVLKKSDPRIPDGLGYVYFPMFSGDGRLFAFAASANAHDHFKADYEVFVAESDPDTLELFGEAVRMTHHPATDRFPDVFLAPLPLGRFRGEAPFDVSLKTESLDAARDWAFDFGDGTTGSRPRHRYETPGRYELSARSGDLVLEGQILVRPARPPRVQDASILSDGRELVLRFDEQIEAESPRIELASGGTIKGWSVGPDRRSLTVRPAEPLTESDRLSLSGVSDRAQRPNLMEPAVLDLEPPLWPLDRRGLVFLWESGEDANLIRDQWRQVDRAASLERYGRARLDHDHAMVLGDGAFVAGSADADYVSQAVKATNELAIEATVRPAATEGTDLGYIMLFSGGGAESLNFALAQRGTRLVFSPRVGNRGPGATPEVAIADLPAGATSHVLVTYQAGRLAAYLNGERVLDTAAVQGDFFHWKKRPLIVGSGHRSQNEWAGRLEGIAIYSRFIEAEEARENFSRYRRKMLSRPQVERLVVEATLEQRSPTPRLREISPYREALSVLSYRVERVLEGEHPGGRLRVAHWSLLDGKPLEIDRLEVGSTVRLALEPFAANRQLESVYLSDTLGAGDGGLFFAVSP